MKHVTGLLVAAGLLAATGSASAEFTLTFRDGMVTLVADNVTVRQILTEWARVGQTKVVNADKLSGPPVTLRLENVPESQALDTLLRASSGFLVAERPQRDPATSRYDRILVMPPSTLVAATPSRPGAPAPTPMAPPVAQPVMPAPQADDADIGVDAPPNPYGEPRPAETNFDYANPQEFLRRRQEMLQQQQAPAGQPALFPGSVTPYTAPAQQAPTSPSGLPTAPGGSARPGEVVAPAQAPPPAFVNPYGIPPAGAAGAAPMDPDRAKYANPYQPNPPKDE